MVRIGLIGVGFIGMSHLPDMHSLESGHIALGWLHPDFALQQGKVPTEFLVRIKEFAARWCDSIAALGWGAAGGFHTCEFCGKALASGTFGVPSEKRLFYVPEMITHYVEKHGYAPPADFIAAVLSCPLPGTCQYEIAVRPFADRLE